MSQMNDDENVTTREARSKLDSRQDPYWHEFDRASHHLGYYKGNEVRVWMVRLTRGRRKLEERLALADDFENPDGVRVMDFGQARAAARNWCAAQIINEAQQPADDRPFMSAGAPCNRD